MRKIFTNIRGKAVPIILSIALLLTGIMSVISIRNMQGNARVINYIGIVRGATQRLIKKELNNIPDDELIERLNGILEGLSEGSREYDLIKLKSQEFQELLKQMKVEWEEIKAEIIIYREEKQGLRLYELSEDYFELADRTVLSAEKYAEKSVQSARNTLIYMNLVFIILAVISGLSACVQEKRKRKLAEAEEENKKKSEHLAKLFQDILVPMNEISELMYVMDIQNYDLLFVNNAGKKIFNIEDTEGTKCYKVTQGLDAPCPYCPNPFLKENENYTWEFTNPLTKRHYLLKDRLLEWGGRKAKMEIAFDITDTANEKIEMQAGLERDNVLVECIRELYRNHDVASATSYALEQIGKLFKAERAYIIRFYGDYFSNTAEWCAEGINPNIDKLQHIPKNDYRDWLNMFSNLENVIIDDIEKFKDKLENGYQIMHNQGIKSVVLVPLEREGKLDGCIGLDNLPPDFLDNVAAFLQTFRYFLMLAITRNEDEEALSVLSYHDTLTSFCNRNRYIQDIQVLTEKDDSAGVVFLDVNGLKEINDNFGHDEGDKVLKKCANIVKSVFKEAFLYRIGGDEFVIICVGMDDKELGSTVQRLKDCFAHTECKAAIGYHWVESCRLIQSAIAQADENMYADKKEYYLNHSPSSRYRHPNDIKP